MPIMENQSLSHTHTFGSLKHFQTLSCDADLINEFNGSIPAPTHHDSLTIFFPQPFSVSPSSSWYLQHFLKRGEPYLKNFPAAIVFRAADLQRATYTFKNLTSRKQWSFFALEQLFGSLSYVPQVPVFLLPLRNLFC